MDDIKYKKNILDSQILREFIFKKLFAFLKNNEFEKVLEVGSGTIYDSRKYKINCKHLIRTDLKSNVEEGIIQADVTDLQFKDKEFDLVICLAVLEHVFDFQKAIKEIKRVSKNYIYIGVPFIYPEHTQEDYWRFTQMALRKMVNLPVVFEHKTTIFGKYYTGHGMMFRVKMEND